MNNQNKIALITGASRGIGAATAIVMAEQGYDICINYLSDDQAAQHVQSKVLAYGRRCVAIKADASDPEQVNSMYQQIDTELGCLSVLVNNTGILKTQTELVNISIERFQQVLNTNVLSNFLCSQQAIKRMSTEYGGQGGTIVNVSSGAAKSGSPREYIDYAASKGAIDTMTIGLAKELANQDIRVNGVRPGLIYTDIHGDGGEPNRVDRLKPNIPMQRGGNPEEVAQAIYWLASEKASYTTGTIIDVTGGV